MTLGTGTLGSGTFGNPGVTYGQAGATYGSWGAVRSRSGSPTTPIRWEPREIRAAGEIEWQVVVTGAVTGMRGGAAWEIAVDVELVRIFNPDEELWLLAELLDMEIEDLR